MNTKHQYFRLAMELLLSIPPAPASALLAALQRDLGIKHVCNMPDLLAELRIKGFKLRKFGYGESMRVQVVKNNWPMVQRACSIYTARVYGDLR